MKHFILQVVWSLLAAPAAQLSAAVLLRDTPPANSSGRHIQYYAVNKAGIHDRGWVFSRLLGLGDLFNATVHILGGMNGARQWLAPRHSPYVHESWGHYFDTAGSAGHPFHELRPDLNCTNTSEHPLRALLDNASCVNIKFRMEWMNFSVIDMPWRPRYLEPSQDVRDVAQKLVREVTRQQSSESETVASERFGFVHVRRCDRLHHGNDECTEPSRIYSAVAGSPEVVSWFIFYYAEPPYKARLQKELMRLPNQTFLFEDELDFSASSSEYLRTENKTDTSKNNDDNYFKSLVMEVLQKQATVTVETHDCKGGEMPTIWKATMLTKRPSALHPHLLDSSSAICKHGAALPE